LPELKPAWRVWPGERPSFRFVPHSQAQQLDALRLGEGADAGLQRWQELPGFYRFLPVGKLKVTARPLLVELDSGAPALTENRVGSGRVLLFGANETYRWRFKAGERDQDRFWLQLVRYAAGELYAVKSELLALDVTPASIEPDGRATVRARVLEDLPRGANRDGYDLKILRDGTDVRTVKLAAVEPRGAGRFEAPIGNLSEGTYELRLAATDAAGRARELSIPLDVTASYEAELADVSCDHALLRRLAESSGGEFFTLDEIGRVPERLLAVNENRSRYAEQPLWDSAYLFVFVVACFAAEWALRKRLGLA
jgi:hypothetical protein